MRDYKLSLTELMALKDRETRKTAEVYLPGIDGKITIKALPLAEFLDMDGTGDVSTGPGMTRAMDEKIYAHCPDMHRQELQEHFGCAVPTDIVRAMLGESLGDRSILGSAINSLYDIDDTGSPSLLDTVKN